MFQEEKIFNERKRYGIKEMLNFMRATDKLVLLDLRVSQRW